MRIFKSSALLLLLILACTSIEAQMNVMSYNIRYDNPNDGDNWWENRKEELKGLLNYYSPAFIGIQEGLIHQVKYIDSNLIDYSYIGVGRDDGKEKGEFVALFYDTTKVELINSNTFWLSETPNKVSIGWDASMERICTYGLFKIKNTGQSIYLFNCHFDHVGPEARKESSRLICKKIKELNKQNIKVVVMGDFNSEPDNEPILILKEFMQDASEIAKIPLYGPKGTFNSFNECETPQRRIDYIFTKGMEVKSYRHIDDKRKNGLWVSDHLPVIISLN